MIKRDSIRLPSGVIISMEHNPAENSIRIIWSPRPPYNQTQLQEIDRIGIPGIQNFVRQ